MKEYSDNINSQGVTKVMSFVTKVEVAYIKPVFTYQGCLTKVCCGATLLAGFVVNIPNIASESNIINSFENVLQELNIRSI